MLSMCGETVAHAGKDTERGRQYDSAPLTVLLRVGRGIGHV